VLEAFENGGGLLAVLVIEQAGIFLIGWTY